MNKLDVKTRLYLFLTKVVIEKNKSYTPGEKNRNLVYVLMIIMNLRVILLNI